MWQVSVAIDFVKLKLRKKSCSLDTRGLEGMEVPGCISMVIFHRARLFSVNVNF